MFLMIKYEIKKYIGCKRTYGYILLLTLFFIALLVFCEWKVIEDRGACETFYRAAGNSFDEAKKQKIQSEYDKCSERLFVTEESGNIKYKEEEAGKDGTYGKTQIEDYAILRDALLCIEKAEKRKRNVEVLRGEFAETAAGNFYQEERDNLLADRAQLNALVKNSWFGWFSCLAVVFILGPSFCIEKKWKILDVLRVTKRGECVLYLSKILTGFVLAAAVSGYFFLLYVAVQWGLLGITMETFAKPLYFVDGFELCASGLCIGKVLLWQGICSLIVTVLCAFFTMAFSKVMSRGIYAQIVSLLSMAAASVIHLLSAFGYQNEFWDTDTFYLVSAATFYKILSAEKTWNPFSLIQGQYYLEEPRFFVIGTYSYPLWLIPVILAVFIMGGLVLFLSGGRRR